MEGWSFCRGGPFWDWFKLHTFKKWQCFIYLTWHESEARFSKITFTDDQILKILRAFDINKAHGHNEISIRMPKLCDKSIITLYPHCPRTVRTFPDTWKKSNIVPAHKIADKQMVDHYRPVSLLLTLQNFFWKSYFQFNFRVSWRE